MTSVLEKELSEIFEKVSRARKERNLSLQESYDLYFEAKEKYLVAKEKERTEEAGEWMLVIFFLVGRISENFIAD